FCLLCKFVDQMKNGSQAWLGWLPASRNQMRPENLPVLDRAGLIRRPEPLQARMHAALSRSTSSYPFFAWHRHVSASFSHLQLLFSTTNDKDKKAFNDAAGSDYEM